MVRFVLGMRVRAREYKQLAWEEALRSMIGSEGHGSKQLDDENKDTLR